MKKIPQNLVTLIIPILIWSCKEVNTNSNTCFEIYNLMQIQEDSWNNGNIDGFMKSYWQSDSLIFISKSGINYGWDKTITNYKKTYRTKQEMGTLKFENIICKPLNDSSHVVSGKWSLKRHDSIGNISGYYTLFWIKKINGWKIIYDHSS